MTARDGLETTYSLFQAVKYICQNKIPGDIVECGVWRGGSVMLIAYALDYFGDRSRDLYLYDTFAGMTEPSEIDVDFDPHFATTLGHRLVPIDSSRVGASL